MKDREPFFDLKHGHYGAIVVDPPWHFKARGALRTANPQSRRDVGRHYDTMSLAEVKALPVATLAATHCHLFLWTTGPNLQQAFEVIDAWGFKFSTLVFTWVKLRRSFDTRQLRFVGTIDADLHVGLGLTSRKNTELVLLGRRGQPKRLAKDVREVILAPVREHSRKPDEMFRRVERYCAGPYIELFARQSRPGWTSWGHEASKYDRCA